MVIVLLGAFGAGKSTIANELAAHHGFERIIPYTTSRPEDGEINGKDYYFTDPNTFAAMINTGVLAEYVQYTYDRLYGSLKSDYMDGDKVVILTPNGFRQLKQSHPNDNIFAVLITANLGSRVKRYIDRCGIGQFGLKDKDKISSQVERDYAMFLGLEREVNIVVDNNEGTDINDVVEEILQFGKMYR